jgi:hypothetical protein
MHILSCRLENLFLKTLPVAIFPLGLDVLCFNLQQHKARTGLHSDKLCITDFLGQEQSIIRPRWDPSDLTYIALQINEVLCDVRKHLTRSKEEREPRYTGVQQCSASKP